MHHRILLLHTNDIHSHIPNLARVATLIEELAAAHPASSVVYIDAGDCEESVVRLSNLTKGVALHRLLSAAGCAAATVGNAALTRYGPTVLPLQAEAATYPLLLANLSTVAGQILPGTHPHTMLAIGPLRLGVIGVTAPMYRTYEQLFGLRVHPTLAVVRDQAAALRREGANAILLLSHLGIDDDRALAQQLGDIVDIIIGGHSHTLLPQGEQIGQVFLAHAGSHAAHLGRIDLSWDGTRLQVLAATLLPVDEDVPQHSGMLATVTALEVEVATRLQAIIGTLPEPLDLVPEGMCGLGVFLAEVLQVRMSADVGVATVGHAWTDALPAGPLQRLTLYERCLSTMVPGVVAMSGAQLLAMMARGHDPALAAERPPLLRGRPRGLLHVSGATLTINGWLISGRSLVPERMYRVAGTDWELEPYGGLVDPQWELHPAYDTEVIVREVVEAYLTAHA